MDPMELNKAAERLMLDTVGIDPVGFNNAQTDATFGQLRDEILVNIKLGAHFSEEVDSIKIPSAVPGGAAAEVTGDMLDELYQTFQSEFPGGSGELFFTYLMYRYGWTLPGEVEAGRVFVR
jgi:hypothetical protein